MTSEQASASGQISVLICDDVRQIRELLIAIVERRPTLRVVGEAENGFKVIAKAERLQPDVVLLDLSMPGMTGFDALPQIKQVAPETKVIILSGFAAEVIADDALAQGADRYIEKGASPDLIANAIEELGQAALVRRGLADL